MQQARLPSGLCRYEVQCLWPLLEDMRVGSQTPLSQDRPCCGQRWHQVPTSCQFRHVLLPMPAALPCQFMAQMEQVQPEVWRWHPHSCTYRYRSNQAWWSCLPVLETTSSMQRTDVLHRLQSHQVAALGALHQNMRWRQAAQLPPCI